MNSKVISKNDILQIIDYAFGDLKNDEVQKITERLHSNTLLATFEKNIKAIINKSRLNKSQIIELLIGDIS